MLKEFKNLRVIIAFIIPYILLYSVYIQLNGEISPGGGFQAGVIFGSGIIAFDMVFGKKALAMHFSTTGLTLCAILGVFIYAGTGVVSLIFNDNYLNYNAIANVIGNGVTVGNGIGDTVGNTLAQGNIVGQHIGIFSIELGVGLTVAAVMSLIYSLLREDA